MHRAVSPHKPPSGLLLYKSATLKLYGPSYLPCGGGARNKIAFEKWREKHKLMLFYCWDLGLGRLP